MGGKTTAVAVTISVLTVVSIVTAIVVCYIAFAQSEKDYESPKGNVYGDFRIGMTIEVEWVTDLGDKTSAKWKTFVEDFEQNMQSAFGYSPLKDIVNKATVIGLRKGSIKVDMGIKLNQLFYNIANEDQSKVKVNLEAPDVEDATVEGIKTLVKYAPSSILSKADLSCIIVEKTTEKKDAVEKECVSKTDIVFLLDKSGSIGFNNFITLKYFVSNFSASSDVNKDNIQIGVVTFDDDATSEFSLNQYRSSAQIVKAVNKINYDGGGTNIARAISYVQQRAFNNSRPNATSVLILMTDGDSEDASMAARNLRNTGVIVVCIGIGRGVKIAHLNKIASRKGLVFPVTAFDNLHEIRRVTLQISCNANYTCYGDIADLVNITGEKVENVTKGVQVSEAEVTFDINEINVTKSCFISAGKANCIHPALIAALASRESRVGRLLKNKNGWGDSGMAYGILQCDKRAQPVRNYGYNCTSYQWNSCEHIRMMTAFVLVPLIHNVQKKFINWHPEQQIQGGVAAYNFGIDDVRNFNTLDEGSTGDDYSNDVIARAQFLMNIFDWNN